MKKILEMIDNTTYMPSRCPRCNSTEIFPVTGGVCGQIYQCKSCQYQGSFVIELEDEDPYVEK